MVDLLGVDASHLLGDPKHEPDVSVTTIVNIWTAHESVCEHPSSTYLRI